MTTARALAFDQDAGELAAVDQQVVRPFQRDALLKATDTAGDGVMHRERRDERQLGRAVGRRGVGQQQAGVKVAGLRHPFAAAAATTGTLPRRGDPQRPPLAGTRARQPVFIGRGDGVVTDEPRAGRSGCGVKLHQNSDRAAALAAASSGAG